MQPTETIAWIVAALAPLALVRLLPFIAYLIGRPGTPMATRLSLIAAFSGLCAATAAADLERLAWVAGAALYFAAASSLLWWLGRPGPAAAVEGPSGIDAPLSLCTLLGAFVALPAVAVPATAAASVAVLGWDLALKAYSYLIDRKTGRVPLQTALFFMLVDPTLVFSRRGVRFGTPGLRRGFCARVAQGAFFIALPLWLSEPLRHLADAGAHGPAHVTLAVDVAVTLLRLASLYWMASGLASLQLGMMGLCGYRVQERYRRPLLARSPADFWRRWNTYVGDWAKRYLYMPLARALARRVGRERRGTAAALALCATFLVVGALHDVYAMVASREPTATATAFFAAQALIVLAFGAWERVRDAGDRASLGARASSQVTFTAVFLYAAGLWL